ncbi:putative PEP-binding protein [Phormidium nigroviride]
MQNLYWLNQIQSSDRDMVGDKAFYLSDLMQRGYPVARGFVVAPQTFWDFLSEIDWLEPLFADLPNSSLYFNADNPHQLQAIAQRIRHQIISAKLPEALASSLESAVQQLDAKALIFRPSLTNTNIKTSGLLESQVVWTDSEAIATGLKRAWAELFRAKSLFYWQRCGQSLQKLAPTVLVQPLRNAIASGSIAANGGAVWEIQASWGLGMSLVWGEAIPDCYQVQPETRNIQSQQLGHKNIAYNLAHDRGDGGTQQNSHFILRRDREASATGASFVISGAASPLQARALSEVEQNQYALDQPYLQGLMDMAEKAKADLGCSLVMEWTLCQLASNSEPQLYVTQVSLSNGQHRKGDREDEKLSLSSPICFRGLPAAAGTAIATAQVITNPNSRLSNFLAGGILVASEISPEWLPWLKLAAGVISERGGMTGHGAILARELGIPAVVGVADATHAIKTGDSLLIDGNKGEVYLMSETNINNSTSGKAYIAEEKYAQLSNATAQSLSIEGITDFSSTLNYPLPIATKLYVNVSQIGSIERIKNLPLDGIGLLRSELMALEALDYQHPRLWLHSGRQAEFVERMADQLALFAAALAPRPVFYRSLDLRESGVEGSFSYVLDPELFDLELTVIERVYQLGYSNVNLILPFVRSVEDFSFCRNRLETLWGRLHPDFQLWIMAEVPSVLFLLPDYVKAGVQGITIGTNDLTQLLLGIDRDSEQMASVFNSRHPAAIRAIQQLIEMANTAGIPCSICGDAPALYPEMIDSLIRWGITSISVNVEAVERTGIAIARAEQRLILQAARQRLR